MRSGLLGSQVWFSHKRRKEKKDLEDAAIRAELDRKHAEERQQQEAGTAGQPVAESSAAPTPGTSAQPAPAG